MNASSFRRAFVGVSATLRALSHGPGNYARLLGSAIGCLALALVAPAQAADNWVDISSALLTRLTNSGAKAAWPGG